MFKVLLVDDEPMAIEALKLVADWEDYGFSILGECCNGEEAIEHIEREKPDLVITDVTMPIIDGLELVRRVKERPDYQDIMFIIVSGYDEFEYAKCAMKYGVNHYLLKPVFKEEFVEILTQIVSILKKNREYSNLFSYGTEINIGYLFNEFLNKELGEETLRENLDGIIGRSKLYWTYTALYMDLFSNNATESESLEIKYFDILKSSINNEARDVYIYPIYNNRGPYGLVICGGSEKLIRELLRTLESQLEKLFNDKFYIAAGSIVNELNQLQKSKFEAEAALEYRFFNPEDRLLIYKEISSLPVSYSVDELSPMEEIQKAFENLDRDNLLQYTKELFDIFKSSYLAPEIIKLYLSDVLCKSFTVIEKMGGVVEDITHIPDMLNLLDKSTSITELERMMECYVLDFTNFAKSLKEKGKKTDRDLVEEYILNNYTRSLTIKEIAQNLYIHPTYLGLKINKWFGCSYNEYLHKLRMEEAGRLLLSTEMKVHEIAQVLGYSSYNNFLEQFVKFYSLKPSEYKNK